MEPISIMSIDRRGEDVGHFDGVQALGKAGGVV